MRSPYPFRIPVAISQRISKSLRSSKFLSIDFGPLMAAILLVVEVPATLKSVY